MANLRQILDKKTTIDLQAYGTSEGVTRAWDSRGRGHAAATGGDTAYTATEHTKAAELHGKNAKEHQDKAMAAVNEKIAGLHHRAAVVNYDAKHSHNSAAASGKAQDSGIARDFSRLAYTASWIADNYPTSMEN